MTRHALNLLGLFIQEQQGRAFDVQGFRHMHGEGVQDFLDIEAGVDIDRQIQKQVGILPDLFKQAGMLDGHATLLGQRRTEVDFLFREILRTVREQRQTANDLALYHDRDDEEGSQSFGLLHLMTIHPAVGGAVTSKEMTLFFQNRHHFPRLGETLFDISLRQTLLGYGPELVPLFIVKKKQGGFHLHGFNRTGDDQFEQFVPVESRSKGPADLADGIEVIVLFGRVHDHPPWVFYFSFLVDAVRLLGSASVFGSSLPAAGGAAASPSLPSLANSQPAILGASSFWHLPLT